MILCPQTLYQLILVNCLFFEGQFLRAGGVKESCSNAELECAFGTLLGLCFNVM